MRAYAKAFRAKGDQVQLVITRKSQAKSMRLKVLHFGDSYVAAAAFTAQRQTQVATLGSPESPSM
jgi:CelD/BcsL family acetyltransferase involved in cellulose biosynthesis